MKKLILILTIVSSLIYFSCSNNNDENSAENSNSLNLDAGKVHNDMLLKYEQSKKIAKDLNLQSKSKSEEFDDMVSIVDAELLALGSPVSYSQVLAQDPSLKAKLLEIIEAEANIDLINGIFDQMREDEISSYEQHYNSKNLMNLLKQYEGNPELFNENILTFEDNILNNHQLDNTFKEELLYAISIAKSSHYYWHEDDEGGEARMSMARGRGMMIAGADTAGALAGIQSGAVATAAVIFPGWGGFIALVGSAAISSMMAGGILR